MIVRRIEGAIAVVVDGDLIVCGPERQLVSLSPSAGALWSCLDTAASLDELIADVQAVVPHLSPDLVARDVRRGIEQLVEARLAECLHPPSEQHAGTL